MELEGPITTYGYWAILVAPFLEGETIKGVLPSQRRQRPNLASGWGVRGSLLFNSWSSFWGTLKN
jgi:hypothetical protein